MQTFDDLGLRVVIDELFFQVHRIDLRSTSQFL